MSTSEDHPQAGDLIAWSDTGDPRTARSSASPCRRSARWWPSRCSCSPTRRSSGRLGHRAPGRAGAGGRRAGDAPSTSSSSLPTARRRPSPGGWVPATVRAALAVGHPRPVARRSAWARSPPRSRWPTAPGLVAPVRHRTPRSRPRRVTYLRWSLSGCLRCSSCWPPTGVLRGLQDTRTPLRGGRGRRRVNTRAQPAPGARPAPGHRRAPRWAPPPPSSGMALRHRDGRGPGRPGDHASLRPRPAGLLGAARRRPAAGPHRCALRAALLLTTWVAAAARRGAAGRAPGGLRPSGCCWRSPWTRWRSRRRRSPGCALGAGDRAGARRATNRMLALGSAGAGAVLGVRPAGRAAARCSAAVHRRTRTSRHAIVVALLGRRPGPAASPATSSCWTAC